LLGRRELEQAPAHVERFVEVGKRQDSMGLARWQPQQAYSKQEQFLMKRLTRTRKLFGFLREFRHELFGDDFHGAAPGRWCWHPSNSTPPLSRIPQLNPGEPSPPSLST
jgi:hypothetical protein